MWARATDQALFDVLKELHQRVAMLSFGGMILVPAGWVNDKGHGPQRDVCDPSGG